MDEPTTTTPTLESALLLMVQTAESDYQYALGAIAKNARAAAHAALQIAEAAEAGGVSTDWLEHEAARVTESIVVAKGIAQQRLRFGHLARIAAGGAS